MTRVFGSQLCERLLPSLVGGVSVSGVMKRLLIFICVFLWASPVWAQTPDTDTLPDITPEELPAEPVPEPKPEEPDETQVSPAIENQQPDYSHLSKEAERSVRLNRLFERLGDETEAEKANLIAEEIWVLWLDSGSASVNMLLRRGSAAEKKADLELARRMYDHVTTLSPEFAEGWARSARLAYMEDDLNRAVHEVTQALILEPRHFYALWTLGNVLEKLGRREEALETYIEAMELYPELEALKTRVTFLEAELNGSAL